ncbi:ATP-binding protein [Candidatus Dojkabacteria bacterium]|jgi:DNA topoisomerase-2|nr:ATP-binding protein [Candidatus Dojkabacteria bacterium]
MAKKTIEERYIKLEPVEHILKKPGMYIGNTYTEPTKMFVFNDTKNISDNKFEYKTVDYNGGFCKLYDEVLTNASDHYIRTKQVKYINVNVKKDHIIIENDGPGIPVVMHKQHKMYVAELIFANLHSGENFDNNDQRMVGGTHGLGIKLTNIYSKKFIVETADGKHKYVQTFTDNMSNKTKPKISKSTKNYTKITYYPDFEKFNLTEITDEIQSIFCKRAIDVAAYNPGVKVYYNDTLIPIKSFKDYMKMFIGDDDDLFYEKINDNWEIGISKSQYDTFQQVSMVNGISTHIGGTHVNYITNQILKLFSEKLEKTTKNTIKQNMIKNHLFLFLSCRIPNPDFETQTKENLVSRMTNDIIKDVNISDNFIKKLMSSSIKTDILNFASFKEFQEAKKSTQNGLKSKVKIAKLDDANKAGKNPDNLKCHLFLTEGDSAASTCKRGFSVTGTDYYGLFPLKGKPLNVRDLTLNGVRENVEISSIISALGLEFGKKYNSTRSLRYGKLVIMSDADCDGAHIRGLIINLFDKFWPELLQYDFIYEFITPIVSIKKSDKKKYFYRLSDYEKWKSLNETGWFIKWIKGLGSIEPSEAKMFFKDISKHLIKFNSSDIKKEKDLIDLAFNKKRVEDRKDWLSNYKPNSFELDKFKSKQTYSSFFNNEFIDFSMENNIRSIPSIVDGLKPSQRKILYTLFKRNFKNEVKVESLMGSILELAAYHHGPQSLEKTIKGMAQDFVGSNNINLLTPNGEFGTRLRGGDDASASRYIFTKLESITRNIFKNEDDEILESTYDDGYEVEPKYYVPIIPMVLINGSKGLGTGWSSDVSQFNPIDIISYIEAKIKNQKKNIILSPFYKGFKGEIIEDFDKGRYITRGIFKKTSKNKINILELPISTWTSDYCIFLDDLIKNNIIKDYDKYSTDCDINIIVTMNDDELISDDDIIKLLHLESYISMNNMHLFDEDGKIKLYNDQYDIINTFIDLRLKYYTKRKEHILNKLNNQKNYISNKMKFINCVLKKDIVFENKQKENIIKQIEQNNIEMYNNSYDYLLNTPLLNLSIEKLEELKNQFEKNKNEIDRIINLEEKNIWLSELNELKKYLK